MAVDLYELSIGDYVMFRNGGHAKVTGYEASEMDEIDLDDDFSHSLTFEGYICSDDYKNNGSYYEDDNKHMLDIVDVVPAVVIERKLLELAKGPADEYPF